MSAPAGDFASDSSGSIVVFIFLCSNFIFLFEVSVQHVQGTRGNETLTHEGMMTHSHGPACGNVTRAWRSQSRGVGGPAREPLNPCFLLVRLHGLLPVCRAHPRHSLRRRDACENGHACQHRARPAAPSQATNFHKLASTCSKKRIGDLACCDLRFGGQAEIWPSDHLSPPRRRPALVQIEAVRPLGVVRTPLGERHRPHTRAIGKPDHRHRRSLRLRALPAVAMLGWASVRECPLSEPMVRIVRDTLGECALSSLSWTATSPLGSRCSGGVRRQQGLFCSGMEWDR